MSPPWPFGKKTVKFVALEEDSSDEDKENSGLSFTESDEPDEDEPLLGDHTDSPTDTLSGEGVTITVDADDAEDPSPDHEAPQGPPTFKVKSPTASIKSSIGSAGAKEEENNDSSDIHTEPLNFEYEDQWIRFQKLSQKYSTQEQQTNQLLNQELFKEIAQSIEKNIKKTIEHGALNEKQRYAPETKLAFSKAVKSDKVHGGVNSKLTGNDLTITLPDNNSVTSTFKEAEKKILITATDSGDQSLIILLESALKAAQKMGREKFTFAIYPCDDITQVAKLFALAKKLHLNPQYKEDPDITDAAVRTKQYNDFIAKVDKIKFKTPDPQSKYKPIPGKENPPDQSSPPSHHEKPK